MTGPYKVVMPYRVGIPYRVGMPYRVGKPWQALASLMNYTSYTPLPPNSFAEGAVVPIVPPPSVVQDPL